MKCVKCNSELENKFMLASCGNLDLRFCNYECFLEFATLNELDECVLKEIELMDKDRFLYLINSYDNEGLNKAEYLELFSYLIKSGMGWEMQGFYQHECLYLIESGYISEEGDILMD